MLKFRLIHTSIRVHTSSLLLQILLFGFSIDDAPRTDPASTIVAVTITCDASATALRLATPFVSDTIDSDMPLGPHAETDSSNSASHVSSRGLYYNRHVTLVGTHERVNDGLREGLVYLRSSAFQGGDTFTVTVTQFEGGSTADVANGAASTSVVSWLDLNLRSDDVSSSGPLLYPTIAMLRPSRGPSTGGTPVSLELQNANISGPLGPLYCQFGSATSTVPLMELNSSNATGSTTASCEAPPSAIGDAAVLVRVTNLRDFWSNPVQFW